MINDSQSHAKRYTSKLNEAKRRLPASALACRAKVTTGKNGWPETNIEIRNNGHVTVYDLTFRIVVRSEMELDHVMRSHKIDQLAPSETGTLEYGDWSDILTTFMEVSYRIATNKSKKLHKRFCHLADVANAMFDRMPDNHIQDALSGFAKMNNTLVKGELIIEFYVFDWHRKRALPDVRNIPKLFVIPCCYSDFIKSRWFEFLSPELLAPVMSHFRHGTVLVLGKDSGAGLKRLKIISAKLEESGYTPVLLKEIGELSSQSNEEKMLCVALLSRFVVIDDTEPSGHIAELTLLSRNRIVSAILRRTGHGGTYMQIDYDVDFSGFMRSWNYGERNLQEIVKEVVKWANETVDARAKKFKKLYPWRNA